MRNPSVAVWALAALLMLILRGSSAEVEWADCAWNTEKWTVSAGQTTVAANEYIRWATSGMPRLEPSPFDVDPSLLRTENDAAQPPAQCALIDQPLFHSSPTGPTIPIFVKRIGNASAANNVWVLQGGPGADSTHSEQ